MTYLPDTHALIWYLTGDKRLGAKAKAALVRVDEGKDEAIVPVLVLAEILYLNEKGRIEISVEQIVDVLNDNEGYRIVPLTLDEIVAAQEIKDASELFDRMIAATAQTHKAVLVTRDHVLAKIKGIDTLW